MDMHEVFGPKHHGGSNDPFETIKVLEAWLTPDEMIGFCKGQSIVYQRRHRAKGGLADLAKSAWYQSYLVKYLAARGLSGLGPTSVPPLKNDGTPTELPPEQQRVPPAPAASDTAGAAPDPQPESTLSPAPSPEPGAGAAAEGAASPGSLEADIAAMAAKFAPVRQEQAA